LQQEHFRVSEHLTSHHRSTLHKVFDHGGGAHNVEWREVISLLEAVGTVEEEHNGKFKVMLGESLLFLHRPKHKDVDTQMLVDIRKALESAGYGPGTPAFDER
jgi:nucleoside-diphosphate-sugar epimerase